MNMVTVKSTIHPPIQGGNGLASATTVLLSDTPSHTGRKRLHAFFEFRPFRYTLPYREETKFPSGKTVSYTIHPPVQGGNSYVLFAVLQYCDTPSRTGRKPQIGFVCHGEHRYTLPYREETLSVYAGFSPSKHLVVQFAQIVFFHY